MRTCLLPKYCLWYSQSLSLSAHSSFWNISNFKICQGYSKLYFDAKGKIGLTFNWKPVIRQIAVSYPVGWSPCHASDFANKLYQIQIIFCFWYLLSAQYLRAWRSHIIINFHNFCLFLSTNYWIKIIFCSWYLHSIWGDGDLILSSNFTFFLSNFADKLSDSGNFLLLIWQGLRCCRKWGVFCQQNSDA